MKIEKIEISQFRHLNNINFGFGETITVIAGGNGTGKTSLLGIIGHIFKYNNSSLNLFDERFETKYSSVFRFSSIHDSSGIYKYKLFFADSSYRDGQLRVTTENGKTRHRIDVGGRVRSGGKILKPVIFLSLKRLIPLAQENEHNIKVGSQSLSTDLALEYNEIYNEIFSTNTDISPIHTKSNNKNSFSPTTDNFDIHGISAGQDNIGQIILSLLSFKQLKQSISNYDGGLLLIDEIDATLYPAAQKNLLKVLLRLGKELNLQIVFTTHSSDLLNFLSSRKGAAFKNNTNFVSLSNALGKISVKQGFAELETLLADLNHEAIRTIKPKKVNFYFEDNEAYLFYKNIIDEVDLGFEKSYKNLSVSCGTYKTLIDKGFEEFFRSVVVLDGDFSTTLSETSENSVVFLPGSERPENIVKAFLQNLPDDDIFWNNTHMYTKRVFVDNISGVKNNREDMKRWFKSQIDFWGEDGKSLFQRWKQLNQEESNRIINRTRLITRRIMNDFYQLSTYN